MSRKDVTRRRVKAVGDVPVPVRGDAASCRKNQQLIRVPVRVLGTSTSCRTCKDYPVPLIKNYLLGLFQGDSRFPGEKQMSLIPACPR